LHPRFGCSIGRFIKFDEGDVRGGPRGPSSRKAGKGKRGQATILLDFWGNFLYNLIMLKTNFKPLRFFSRTLGDVKVKELFRQISLERIQKKGEYL
jgi:hypothetical protein